MRCCRSKAPNLNGVKRAVSFKGLKPDGLSAFGMLSTLDCCMLENDLESKEETLEMGKTNDEILDVCIFVARVCYCTCANATPARSHLRETHAGEWCA